jgi:chromosome segregation ATPase
LNNIVKAKDNVIEDLLN